MDTSEIMSILKKVTLLHGSYTDELAELIQEKENIELIQKERKLFVAESNSKRLYDLINELCRERKILLKEDHLQLLSENRDREWKIVEAYFGIYTASRARCSYRSKNGHLYIILFR